jgi:hypothetical protein
MNGTAMTEWDGHDRLAVIDHLQNIQRAAPSTLKVPQKVLLLLSETFLPHGEQADMPQRPLKGLLSFPDLG